MLEHTQKRVIVKVDMQSKNSYRFSNGQILVMFPNTNNMDRRYSQPVNGIVISADDLPCGCEVLLEHNSCHPTNQIFDYDDTDPNIKYFSVPELEVFVWRNTESVSNKISKNHWEWYENGIGWQPTKYYAIGERVYEPYKGRFHNVKPTQIKNTLLIKTGEFKDKIVHIRKNGEYTIIYQDNGKPHELLVTFHAENADELSFAVVERSDSISMEELIKMQMYAKQEIVAVNQALTERWMNGELLTGLTEDDCKQISPYHGMKPIEQKDFVWFHSSQLNEK